MWLFASLPRASDNEVGSDGSSASEVRQASRHQPRPRRGDSNRSSTRDTGNDTSGDDPRNQNKEEGKEEEEEEEETARFARSPRNRRMTSKALDDMQRTKDIGSPARRLTRRPQREEESAR